MSASLKAQEEQNPARRKEFVPVLSKNSALKLGGPSGRQIVNHTFMCLSKLDVPVRV